jgi:4-carboxymuconolactone decarboxylase
VSPSRIEGVPRDQWSDDVAALLLGTVRQVHGMEGDHASGDDEPLPILTVLAHQPPLLRPFLDWAAALALAGALAHRDAELLALRAAWNCRSPFEWEHHARFALAAGATPEELARLAAPGYEGWAERDAALVRAADELHRDTRVGDETWKVLTGCFGAPELVEIPLVVGQYSMLSMLANVAGLPAEGDLGPGW